MLKYIALMMVDRPQLWSQWHSGPTSQYYKSPVETNKKEVQKWLKDKLKEYPNANVNSSHINKEYYIRTTVIAFDDEETKDFEDFLSHGMIFLS